MTLSTKRLPAKHTEWVPYSYQARAEKFLMENGAAALFLDPGLGKTSIVLSAFSKLKAMGVAKKMLVIAPLRVCELVWRQEAAQWTQFRHLNFSFLHGGGSKKEDALKADADIYLINPEGIAWLAKKFPNNTPLPFDTICVDELTKFKNARSVRFNKLRPRIRNAARRWGLTGTPAPNGLLDLFGQILLLDGGRTFGKYITHFRDKYFVPDFMGFNYTLQPGAEKRIQDKLEPISLRMKAEDYLDLPPCVDHIIEVEMDKKSRKIYDEMKKDMLTELEEGEVVAGNAAAVMSKLKQMANGAVYVTVDADQPRKVAPIHDAKLDALEALVEELNGAPLLVAYEFNHDLSRLQERFGSKLKFLGNGVSSAQAVEIEKDWNANRIPILAVHPASVGHGLNMQKGGAGHICWFGVTWDLELYLQLLRRILRQGTTAERIMNHMILVKDTVDFMCAKAIREKDTSQARLLQGLTGYLHGNIETENDMRKLRRPGAEEPAAENAVKPAGWGKPATDAPAEEESVKGNISDSPEDRVDPAQELEDNATDEQGTKSMFSSAVKDALNAPEEEQSEPPGRGEPDTSPRRPVQSEPSDPGTDAHKPSDAGNDAPERNKSGGLSKLKKAELIAYAEELEAKLAQTAEVPNERVAEPTNQYAQLGLAQSAPQEATVEVRFYGDPDKVSAAMRNFLK